MVEDTRLKTQDLGHIMEDAEAIVLSLVSSDCRQGCLRSRGAFGVL